ncbi:hypothetical protein E5983_00755 [Streptococcus danieliae]|uniref:Uncharacterized protein n=1 Tax=Streptococcus danieliae TaxID=747656 RepID=A0A7X3G8K6_9STRE|nr:hypothetical protein [Streptococcus danieliae]MVX58204.1 hypothetical protein [Streptococcus danieliae]
MKHFLERIQKIEILSVDKFGNLQKGVAYDLETYPTEFKLVFQIHFLNIQPDTDYSISLEWFYGQAPDNVNVSLVMLNIPEIDMIKIKDGYGLAFGSFDVNLPLSNPDEIKFNLMLYRHDSDTPKLLSTFESYLVFGEVNHAGK